MYRKRTPAWSRWWFWCRSQHIHWHKKHYFFWSKLYLHNFYCCL